MSSYIKPFQDEIRAITSQLDASSLKHSIRCLEDVILALDATDDPNRKAKILEAQEQIRARETLLLLLD